MPNVRYDNSLEAAAALLERAITLLQDGGALVACAQAGLALDYLNHVMDRQNLTVLEIFPDAP